MADMDTAVKRRSTINMTSPFRAGLPDPTGTVDASERAFFLFLYAGLSLASNFVSMKIGSWIRYRTI